MVHPRLKRDSSGKVKADRVLKGSREACLRLKTFSLPAQTPSRATYPEARAEYCASACCLCMLYDNYEGGLRMHDYICTIVLCEKAINYISCHDPI